MKKLVSTGIITLVAVGICIFCIYYVMDVSDQATEKVTQIQSSVLNKEYTAAKEKAQQLEDFWEDQHTMLSIIIHHEMLEDIEESVALIKTHLENHKNPKKSAEFWEQTTRAITQIKNLRDVEIPSTGNIL